MPVQQAGRLVGQVLDNGGDVRGGGTDGDTETAAS